MYIFFIPFFGVIKRKDTISFGVAWIEFVKFEDKWYRKDALLKKTSKELRDAYRSSGIHEPFIIKAEQNLLLCYSSYYEHTHFLYFFKMNSQGEIEQGKYEPEVKFNTDNTIDATSIEYINYINYLSFSVYQNEEHCGSFYIVIKDGKINYVDFNEIFDNKEIDKSKIEIRLNYAQYRYPIDYWTENLQYDFSQDL